MIRLIALIAALTIATAAQARHHHHHYRMAYSASQEAIGAVSDPRPHAWCGWWLRHELGVADRSYNLARNWVHFGSSAGGPAVGTIVVWYHHVGLITARATNGWVIRSGNDNHAVRERERSVSGAIAFRWAGRMAGL